MKSIERNLEKILGSCRNEIRWISARRLVGFDVVTSLILMFASVYNMSVLQSYFLNPMCHSVIKPDGAEAQPKQIKVNVGGQSKKEEQELVGAR